MTEEKLAMPIEYWKNQYSRMNQEVLRKEMAKLTGEVFYHLFQYWFECDKIPIGISKARPGLRKSYQQKLQVLEEVIQNY